MKLARTTLAALTTAAALLALAAPASARECEGIKFPESVTVEGTKLVLNGLGIREATVFNVNVYVAGLYVEQKAPSASAHLDATGPRRLVLHFVRDVDKADITGAFTEGFKNSGKAGALGATIAKLIAMVPDAKDGAEWTFTYVPDKGMEVKIGGAVKGTLEGADFFRAFLGIWLGPKPPNTGLKKGLLGGSCG